MRYSDEVRKELKDVKQRIRRLNGELVDKQRRSIDRMALFKRIMVAGQIGDFQIDPKSLLQEVNKLDQEIAILKAEIGPTQKGLKALESQLMTAPKRPKVRSKVASIAASGSRAISEEANARPGFEAPISAWDNAIAAAEYTARKYGLGKIPEESLSLIKTRLLERFPGVSFTQRKDSVYPSVVLGSTGSLRKK